MSPDSMTSGWYYAKAGAPKGNEVGPLSWEELYLLAKDGVLAVEDLVWNPKLPRGVAAGTVPGLFQTTPTPQQFPTQAPVPAEFVPLQPAQSEEQAFPPPAQPVPQTPADSQLSAALAAAQVEPVLDSEPVATDQPLTDPLQAGVSPDELAVAGAEDGSTAMAEEATTPSRRTGKQTSSLPLLVVLLALVIAAAGLITYFLFFRDELIGEQSGLLQALSVVSTLPFGA